MDESDISGTMHNMNESKTHYLLSLILTFAFSCVLPMIREDMMYVPASLIILLVAYDVKDVLYFVVMCLTTMALLNRYVRHVYARYILMGTNMAYLVLYKTVFSASNLDVSGALMLLVIKGYYLGKEYNNTSEMKKALSYLFLTPGIMLGPVMSYSKYCNGKRKICVANGFRRVVGSLVFLIVHVLLSEKYSYKDVTANDNMLVRIIMLVVLSIIHKCKYYFAWSFACGCFTLIGMNDMKNIYPLRVEFSDTFNQIQSGWNVYTNAWLKDSIFMPLKGYGAFKASLATFAVSALWHGLNPCYFIMFMTFSLSVPLLKNNSRVLSMCLGSRFTKLINIITMSLYIGFFSVPFLVLDIKELNAVWMSVNYYGVVFLAASIILYAFTKQK